MQCQDRIREVLGNQCSLIPSSFSSKSPARGDIKFSKESSRGLKFRAYSNSLTRRASLDRNKSQKVNLVRGLDQPVSSIGDDAREISPEETFSGELQQEPIRTLLLDNYDSYTYNLYQLISVINGVAPVVLRNDEIKWEDLCRLLYEERAFHNVVISPGPGSPACASDVGICMQLLQECHDIPILGVCLGHQALGCVHGAQILHAPEPVHGRLSEIEHNGHPIFAGIPSGANSGFKVVRYHSLIVDAATLPDDLVPTAWTVVESGLMMLDDWQGGIDSPEPVFLSEGQLSWHGRGSAGSAFPMEMTNGLSGFEEVDKAKGDSKVLMGVSHRRWPHHGVQFHPESVGTTYGRQILENFRRITVEFWEQQQSRPARVSSMREIPRPLDFGILATSLKDNGQAAKGPVSLFMIDGPKLGRHHSHSAAEENGEVGANRSNPVTNLGEPLTQEEHLRLAWEKLSGFATRAGGSKTLFCKLFGEEAVEDTFWLDSSTREQGRARFSFMGGRGGPLWQRITYRLPHKSMVGTHGVLRSQNAAGEVKETVLQEGFLDLLNRELELRRCRTEDYINLPFDFCGGFIGYLGYELKVECGSKSSRHGSSIPDAGMFLADRVVVVDHTNDDVYVLALFEDGSVSHPPGNIENYPEVSHSHDKVNSCSSHENAGMRAVHMKQENFLQSTCFLQPSCVQGDGLKNGHVRLAEEGRCSRRAAETWVEEVVNKIKILGQQNLQEVLERMHHVSAVSSVQITGEEIHPPFVAEKSRTDYIKDVKRCQEFIKDGESYEVCLTTRLRRKVSSVDCIGLYLTLREMNPAPYAAWLHFGRDGPCICSSSPERFLRLDKKGVLEAKPIKGTIARGNTPVEDERLKQELQHSEKDQAENLMIVDLLRNDLGRVCEPGTVHVPSLMAVESYSTVHTLVSTVRGRKRPSVTPIDCVKAAFPGGSMTGAPKLRTMEIIDSLESSPRGVYSGTIGYFSFNSSFDLNIVIRTLVIHDDEASLGAGGAVIALSNPSGEYEEMLLKTKALVKALSKYENDLKSTNTPDQ